jgi:hypothetical protein
MGATENLWAECSAFGFISILPNHAQRFSLLAPSLSIGKAGKWREGRLQRQSGPLEI